jgi:L-ascorbate metabolism protein UlaG (beta-lactamase superfamily)
MKELYLIAVALFLHIGLVGQNQVKSVPEVKTDYWGDIDGYINQQDKVTLNLVEEALQNNPPKVEMPLTRKMALLMIDNVLHEEKASSRPAVQEFLVNRIKSAIKEIKTTNVTKGAMIWKLYNHSYVVKTKSVTIGFDIQRGFRTSEGPVLDKELMQQVVDQVDVLFISHYHGDHTDEWVAETFLAQNKPVVSPPDLWADKPFYAKILHPERKATEVQKINLPVRGINLDVVVNPGHQGGTILNNVYLIKTPEGLTFAQTGDQSNEKDFEWIDKVGDTFKVDVVMTNSWAVYPNMRLYRGFRPKLIIPGHENEMGHTIDHREPYWLNPVRLGDGKTFPWVQLVWGEKYHYLPGRLK